MPKLNTKLWFFILLILSFALRLALLDYTYVRIIEADGVSYISGAKSFLTSFDIRAIGVVDPPLFPMLIALFSLVTPDWETAGRMVSIVSGSFLGPILFLISLSKGNSLRTSIFSALLLAITHTFVITSFQVFNDSLNCALLLAGIWQTFKATNEQRNKNYFFAGIFFAFSFLTRPDSIVPSFFVFMYLTYNAIKTRPDKKALTGLALFTVAVSLLTIPYFIYLHSQLGQWVLGGRQVAAQTNLPSLSAGGNYEEANYGLTPDLALKGNVLAKAKSDGADIKKGFIRLWLENPKQRFSSFMDNLKIERDSLMGSTPKYILVFALIAVLFQFRNFIPQNLLLFAFSSPLLFLYPFFWADTRHVYHYLIPLWLWAAEGLEFTVSAIQRQFQPNRYIKAVYFGICLVILTSLASTYSPKIISPKEIDYLRQKEAGIWISKNTPQNAVVMTRWGRVSFYMDRKWIMFPYAEWDEIKKYMKKNGVTHIVVDERFYDIRPQVQHILWPIVSGAPNSPDNSLEIANIKRDDLGGVIIYSVK